MLNEARDSMLENLPGKEIKKLKANFNCNNVLKKKDFSALPPNFQNYLTEIKKFFLPTEQ